MILLAQSFYRPFGSNRRRVTSTLINTFGDSGQNLPCGPYCSRIAPGSVDGASSDCTGRGAAPKHLLGDVHQFHSGRKQP
jgi:hypothetical protein